MLDFGVRGKRDDLVVFNHTYPSSSRGVLKLASLLKKRLAIRLRLEKS